MTPGPVLLATTLDCTPNAQPLVEFQLLSPPKVGRFCCLPDFALICSLPFAPIPALVWTLGASPGDMPSPSHSTQPHTRWLSRGAPKAQVWLSLRLDPLPPSSPPDCLPLRVCPGGPTSVPWFPLPHPSVAITVLMPPSPSQSSLLSPKSLENILMQTQILEKPTSATYIAPWDTQ